MKPRLLFAVLVLFAMGCDAPDIPQPAAASMESATPAAELSNTVAGESSSRWLEAPATTRRHAVVFGNGAYMHGDALSAPVADAGLVAEALRSRGYHVLLSLDRTLAGMREDLQAFQAMSRDADIRVLYFAGHGFEFDNANYLMPVDLPVGIASLDRDAVRLNGLALAPVVWELGEGAGMVVAIIDSCRVLPSRGPSATPSLARQDVAEGTILAFATAPGQVASDSLRAYGIDLDHSPFSYYLADALRSPEVTTWDQALITARNIVDHRTRGAQQPWWNASVDSFPVIGALPAPTSADTGPLANIQVSPARRAAARYWAAEALAAAGLARDGTVTDAELEVLAGNGDALAAVALSTRRWDVPAHAGTILALLEPHAERGHAVAQADLGTWLHASRSKDSQGRSARHWWALASAQGIGEARAKLALLDGDDADGLIELMRGVAEMHTGFAPAGDTPDDE